MGASGSFRASSTASSTSGCVSGTPLPALRGRRQSQRGALAGGMRPMPTNKLTRPTAPLPASTRRLVQLLRAHPVHTHGSDENRVNVQPQAATSSAVRFGVAVGQFGEAAGIAQRTDQTGAAEFTLNVFKARSGTGREKWAVHRIGRRRAANCRRRTLLPTRIF